ncbi:MAG: D-2-hydroxyacid dehydrogenase family protein [Nitrososphaerota archaeon]
MKIAVLDDYQQVAAAYGPWQELPPSCEVHYFHEHFAATDALIDALAGFDIIVAMRERTPFPSSVLAQLHQLKLLVTTGMANAAIDVAAAAASGITVSGTRSVATGTAELTWALLLALARHIPAEQAALRQGQWQIRVGTGLAGKTLGVVGIGRIGSQIVRYGNAFGMHVIAWSQNLTQERAIAAGCAAVSREELFAHAHVVTVHLKLGERSRGIIGRDDFERMRPDALFINTSRAEIVEEAALIDALQRRRIAGAALDVHYGEPLAADHPLRSTPNTLLTPHLGYVTDDGYATFFTDAVEDIRAYLDGAPVRVLS